MEYYGVMTRWTETVQALDWGEFSLLRSWFVGLTARRNVLLRMRIQAIPIEVKAAATAKTYESAKQ